MQKSGFLMTRLIFSLQVKIEIDSDPEMTDQSTKYPTSEDRTSNSGPERNSTQNATAADGFQPPGEQYVNISAGGKPRTTHCYYIHFRFP